MSANPCLAGVLNLYSDAVWQCRRTGAVSYSSSIASLFANLGHGVTFYGNLLLISHAIISIAVRCIDCDIHLALHINIDTRVFTANEKNKNNRYTSLYLDISLYI